MAKRNSLEREFPAQVSLGATGTGSIAVLTGQTPEQVAAAVSGMGSHSREEIEAFFPRDLAR